MLPVYLDISINAKKIINSNIQCIYSLMLDMCINLSDEEVLGDIFPSFMLQEDLEKCKNTILELYEMLRDEYERDYLKPLYEYVLFHSITWWYEVTDECEKLFEEIPEEECYSSSGENMYDVLNDEKNYLDFMFQDWDFDDVPKLFSIYRNTPALISQFLHIDMDDYVELMPKDIRNQYFELKNNKSKGPEEPIEKFVVKSLYNVLSLEENRPLFYEKHSEVELSDTIRNALFLLFQEKGITIDREDRAGYALHDSGELDFFILKMEDGIYKQIAVGENKKWGKYKESVMQLLGYMNDKTNFGFTIIFNQTTDLNTVITGREQILDEFEKNQEFQVIRKEKVEGMENLLMTIHEKPEHKGQYFRLYHFIFNVYLPERKKMANKARGK